MLVSASARRCAAVLLYKSDRLGPIQAALATYSLGMLGIHDQVSIWPCPT